MSRNKSTNGKATSDAAIALFDIETAVSFRTEDRGPIHIKIAPGTDAYKMIMHVLEGIPNIKPTKAARLLMKAGYLGFLRSMERRPCKDDEAI